MINLFLVTEPLRGWRQVRVSDRRTRRDWAHCVRELVEVHYPHAEAVVLVMDTLNTLEIHYTPKHGRWLNLAEIELSALQRQCLDRRLPDRPTLEREGAAWVRDRTAAETTIDWRSTTADARIKLMRLYPAVHD